MHFLRWHAIQLHDRNEIDKDGLVMQYGSPDTVNNDQGCELRAEEFTNVVRANGYKLRMDGRGDGSDNAFLERFRHSLKYERAYLRGRGSVSARRLESHSTFAAATRSGRSQALKTPHLMNSARPIYR